MSHLISPHLHLAGTQHGFWAGRSTTTALLPLVHLIAAGINQHCPPLRTVAMAVDFSKAYDTINHSPSSVASMRAPWMQTPCVGSAPICVDVRPRASTKVTESKRVIIHRGVSQGSCLSPMLFNAYVSSYPQTAELVTSYDDDFKATFLDKDMLEATRVMAEHEL